MRIHPIFTRPSCLVAAICLSACAPASPGDDVYREATAQQEEPFTTAPQQPNHEEITADALGFLRRDILTLLQEADVSVDAEFTFENAYHFDDCNFSGGSKVIARQQATAVEALDPSQASPVTDAAAAFAFGQSLHTAQDFYAHSNWVELGANGLVDDSLSKFPTLKGYTILNPSGIEIVEGNPPRKTTVERDVGAPYPESALVDVTTKGTTLPGLISGSVDYEPGDLCPVAVRMTHAELNKDQSGIPGREAQFAQARALAVQQTLHEWCRLTALTRDEWGSKGEDRLASWIADPGAAPDCDQ